MRRTNSVFPITGSAQGDKEIGLTEPPKKMRKVTLGSLLGGKIKKEPVRRRRRRSTSWRSRNSYLADTDVPDILNW